MTEQSHPVPKTNWLKMCAAAVGITLLLLSINLTLGIRETFRMEIIAMVYIPAVCMALYCWFRKLGAWSALLQAIGVPLGIFASVFMFVYDLTSMSEDENLFPAIARSFLAIFHGGLIAAFGYFMTGHDVDRDANHSPGDRLALSLMIILPFCAGLLFFPVSISTFFDLATFMLFAAPLVMLTATGPNTLSINRLLRAVVVGMLGPVLISMTAWLLGQGDNRSLGPAMAVGLLGLLYGAWTTFAIGSFRHANTNNLRHLWRASWHSLEIYALLILIVFAPPSLIEIMNS